MSDPYEDLAIATIRQAADDYREAYTFEDTETICEIEGFFRSDWIQMLTNLDGRLILRRLYNECKGLLEQGTYDRA